MKSENSDIEVFTKEEWENEEMKERIRKMDRGHFYDASTYNGSFTWDDLRQATANYQTRRRPT